jgi:hypothetical protein
MIGRLAQGASVDAARTEIDGIAASRAGDSGMRNNRIDGATVIPLAEALAATRTVFILLFGGVAALMLIGSVNLANLFWLAAPIGRANSRSAARSRCDTGHARPPPARRNLRSSSAPVV